MTDTAATNTERNHQGVLLYPRGFFAVLFLECKLMAIFIETVE